MENLTLASLGIPRVLNAATTYTRIGGSRMAPEVLAAMVQGANDFVEIEQLHKVAGERIAQLTKNEAAIGIFGYSFLEENKDKLIQLADILIEKEVIFKDDLEAIFGKRPFGEESHVSVGVE